MTKFDQYMSGIIYDAQQIVQQPAARRSATFTASTLGFTIVELLIVIVIIGILAAIVVVAYTGITQNAKATAIADTFKKLDKAFTLYATNEDLASWPVDNVFTGSGNPTVTSIINSTPAFKNYLQQVPSAGGVAASDWRYDYDSDVYNGCSTGSGGVNVYINVFSDAVLAQKVDEILDDGNLSCGKLRLSATPSLVYSLSLNGSR